jgi:hypothetical protein
MLGIIGRWNTKLSSILKPRHISRVADFQSCQTIEFFSLLNHLMRDWKQKLQIPGLEFQYNWYQNKDWRPGHQNSTSKISRENTNSKWLICLKKKIWKQGLLAGGHSWLSGKVKLFISATSRKGKLRVTVSLAELKRVVDSLKTDQQMCSYPWICFWSSEGHF